MTDHPHAAAATPAARRSLRVGRSCHPQAPHGCGKGYQVTQGLNVRLGAIIPATTPAGTGVARHERGWNFRDRRLDDGWLMIAVLASWLGMQVVHWGAFLFHDAWRHNFPRLYSITKLSGCRDIPRWNGSVDSGWPVI